jgi:exopolyphosphatase/guanosine-5'-triphosphate,3'-diphosphate pyrophosphatase
MSRPGVLAALDCGTNSTRLLIADLAGTTVVREMRVTRLGQGVDATHELSAEAIARTLAVLGEFRAVMDLHGVERARLVATSAVRDATNGSAFLSAASEVTGVPAELLPGTEEGRLAFDGATADVALDPESLMVVDIGGGSTELVTRRGGTVRAHSMDIGCIRVTERFLFHDPPTDDEIAAAVCTIDAKIADAERALPELTQRQDVRWLVGVAGTISTLSALNQGLDGYDRDRIHHAVLDENDVERWCDVLAIESAQQRAIRSGMLEGRQDVIFGGALILRQVMRLLSIPRCLVSESDILDGLVASLRPSTQSRS